MKKTWIKIKRGLLEPKHREQLGPAYFLYLYILDRADWEQGAVLEWTDAGASKELEMDINTLRNHRRRLEEYGYITARQGLHGQKIYIHNWTNPREYSGNVYNKNGKVDNNQGAENLPPLGEEEAHGGSHGSNHVIGELTTPTSSSHITGHIESKESEAKPELVYEDLVTKPTRKKKKEPVIVHPAVKAFRSLVHYSVPAAWVADVVRTVGDDPKSLLLWHRTIKDWLGRGWKPTNVKGMLEAFSAGGIKDKQGRAGGEDFNDRLARRRSMLEGDNGNPKSDF